MVRASEMGSLIKITYMRQHDNLVPRQVNIRFDGMCAYVNSGAKSAERILWKGRFVASVSDGLRQLDCTCVDS
jgi:hypothetical protein